MTEAFTTYLDDFNACFDEIKSDTEKLDSCKTSAERKDRLEKAENNLDELDRYYRILEGESHAGNTKERRTMQTQLRVLKGKIDKTKALIEKERLIAESRERRQNQPRSEDAKENMVNYNRRLKKGGDFLREGQQCIVETEQIAANIDVNLGRQREMLDNARSNVHETRDKTREAGGHLNSLRRKTFTNIICLWGVIILLLAGIGFSVYWKFIKKHKSPVSVSQFHQNSTNST